MISNLISINVLQGGLVNLTLNVENERCLLYSQLLLQELKNNQSHYGNDDRLNATMFILTQMRSSMNVSFNLRNRWDKSMIVITFWILQLVSNISWIFWNYNKLFQIIFNGKFLTIFYKTSHFIKAENLDCPQSERPYTNLHGKCYIKEWLQNHPRKKGYCGLMEGYSRRGRNTWFSYGRG